MSIGDDYMDVKPHRFNPQGDDPLELKRRIAELEAEVASKQQSLEFACKDWADDDTRIKAIAAKHGIREDDAPDMFKGALWIVEELEAKLAARIAALELREKELLATIADLSRDVQRLTSLNPDGVALCKRRDV